MAAWGRASPAQAAGPSPRDLILLAVDPVLISKRIRHRLVTVILLGVITSALSLIALVRVISLTTGQRVERGRAGVQAEVARLLAAGAVGWRGPRNSSGLIGVHGGVVADGGNGIAWLAEVPGEWRATVRGAVRQAGRVRDKIAVESPSTGGVLVVAAQPTAVGDAVAWAGYLIPPPVWLRTWQIIVVALAVATALLVTSAVASVITVKRGASALNVALDGLATDLNTVVPQPRLRELGDVADGIARLAQRLSRAREIQADMARELAMKDRLSALGRVVAGVAHEVRNPLASIKLRLDLAGGSGAPLPRAVEEAIAHASREITRLDRLVADLLVVASPGVGPRQPTAIGPLVRGRVESLAPWCDVRGVAVHVSGDASASVDVDALARAIDNLVRNAVEASPPGGMVDIAVREQSNGEVDVACIAVIDHGPGVPAARTHELFEPFFTTKPDGTGLGLAICRSIARAHGGDCTLARRDDATTVQLTLSRAPSSGRGGTPVAVGARLG